MPPRKKAGPARGRGRGDRDRAGTPVDVQAVTDELYTAPPDGFTALRDEKAAAARGAGDRDAARAIAALRKPALSAWAGNLLVRRRPDETAAFLELGEALRQAHGELDARRMRELSGQQWRIISALSQQAVRLAADAGHRIGQSVQRELETTLRAALADPDAAREWASGTLTAPLTPPSTFAPAGGTRTAAAQASAPSSGRGPEPRDKGKGRDELAERRRKQRQAELERARQALTDAGDRVHEEQATRREAKKAYDRARGVRERAERKVRELHEQLRRAEDDAEHATWTEHQAEDELHTADEALAHAEERLRDARRDVERLSTGRWPRRGAGEPGRARARAPRAEPGVMPARARGRSAVIRGGCRDA